MPGFSTSVAEMLLKKFRQVEPWMEQAECAQGDMEWDPLYAPEADAMVEQVCSRCPVQSQCRDHAQEILDRQPEGSDRKLLGVFGAVNYFPERRSKR